MLEARGLSAAYGLHRALDAVALQVNAGELVVILGANGAGKSTLLKALAGLLPASGEITLDGKPLHTLPARLRVEAGIALVP
ncbi:MAG: ATP-binding cassette domain-containing protein, partial [Elioraea sp.]|nr:ATP-binding cassette domain-containing protein [Elioraea sp.]